MKDQNKANDTVVASKAMLISQLAGRVLRTATTKKAFSKPAVAMTSYYPY